MSCNFFTEPVDVVISHVLEYVPRRGAHMSCKFFTEPVDVVISHVSEYVPYNACAIASF